MKRAAPYVILFLLAMMIWNALSWDMWSPWSGGMTIDGDSVDGPLGFLLATLFAGGGTLIAVLVTIVVAVVLAVVFAGVGVILLGAMGVAVLTVALAVSPLLLPLALPLLLVWYFMQRSRRERLAKPVVA